MAGLDWWPDPLTGDAARWAEEQLRRLAGVLEATRVDWIGVTYASNWQDLGGNYQGVEYCRDGFGFVRMRGVGERITSNMTGATLLTTLPAGFRPAAFELFVTQTDRTGRPTVIEVQADGEVYVNEPNLQVNDILSLSGVCFYAGVRGE